jgi:hypothetical protein
MLGSKILNKMGVDAQRRVEDSYNNLITRYKDAKPMKGRIQAEIEARRPIYEMFEASVTKTNTNITIKINTKVKDEKGDELITFEEIYDTIESMIKKDVLSLLTINKVFKIRFRLNIDLVKYEWSFDGNEVAKVEHDKQISNNSSNQVNRSNIDEFLDVQRININDQIENLRVVAGSNWRIKKYIFLAVDIFSNRKLRGSSYIPTPEKKKKKTNPNCGLINIKNNDHMCFKWCMKYHQTSQKSHQQNISALKKS